MAKYLRPRRGSYANAAAQNILLKKGELFFEFPNSNIGKEPARLIIGDGASSYGDLEVHGSGSSTNSFQPALIHPAIYHVDFNNSNPATENWTFNSGTTAINNIQPRSTNSSTSSLLPKIIGNIKQALVNHADSLTKLNNDLSYAEYYQDNATTIDLNDLKTQNKTYMFGPTAICTNSPYSEGATTGNSYTLQVIKNEDSIPIPGIISGITVVCTQIAYTAGSNNTIYTRHYIGYRRSQTLTDYTWDRWIPNRGLEFYMAEKATTAGGAYTQRVNYGNLSGWTGTELDNFRNTHNIVCVIPCCCYKSQDPSFISPLGVQNPSKGEGIWAYITSGYESGKSYVARVMLVGYPKV